MTICLRPIPHICKRDTSRIHFFFSFYVDNFKTYCMKYHLAKSPQSHRHTSLETAAVIVYALSPCMGYHWWILLRDLWSDRHECPMFDAVYSFKVTKKKQFCFINEFCFSTAMNFAFRCRGRYHYPNPTATWHIQWKRLLFLGNK